ncbi:hypothetical protein Misp06_00270 [Microbulbifer sp. NBRC 101763]|uniref:RHS repeat-associated core domain-containing protein n=1 Tax=Microbulbifer sp. NBRC 101763 TaxID=1113820 RepID=UPI0030B69E26
MQGSLDVITDSTGQVTKDAAGNKLVYSFDAWGKRRNALSWEQIAGAPANTVSTLNVGIFNHLSSNRGYTGHEMLDEVGLIHMNGRVYDPTLARFVSADPLIDGVTSVQGYNRYAYVHNNPLTYTDPSGYSSWNKYRDSVVKPVVAVAIVIWTGGQSLVALQGTNYAAAVGWAAAGGAAAGAVQSGTVKGAFFGAFSAVAFMGIGNAFQGATWATKGVVGKGIMGTGLNGYGYAAKVFAHSVTGGLLSAAQGGKFKHGFAAAGVTQAFAGGIDSIDAGNVGFSATRVVAAALVGGTASVVSGGKFANGAITAAFSRAFNHENHPTAQKRPTGNFSPVPGTYFDENGVPVTVEVGPFGNTVSADGTTAYSFDSNTGTLINPLATGMAKPSAPELMFLGGVRVGISAGYSMFSLAARAGPSTYTNFAINSIGRDTLKVMSFGFLYRVPKFNPSYYWARSGGNYSLAVSKLGRSNPGYDAVFGGLGVIGTLGTAPVGD